MSRLSPRRRRILAAALASPLLALPGGLVFAAKDFLTIDPPAPLPDVAVMTVEGEPTTLAKALPPGKPAVVNLWATWCPPCIRELPALSNLQSALGDSVTVAALSVDRGGPKVVGAFLVKTGLKGLLILTDPRAESLQALKSRGLPTTLLLDAQHREVARFEGDGDWDKPETIAAVKTRLGLMEKR